MVGSSFFRVLSACVAPAVSAVLLAAPALADTVTLSPATWNAGRDGSGTSSPRDGQFDALLPAININVTLSQSAETRSLYEFVLPPALMTPGTVINSASVVSATVEARERDLACRNDNATAKATAVR